LQVFGLYLIVVAGLGSQPWSAAIPSWSGFSRGTARVPASCCSRFWCGRRNLDMGGPSRRGLETGKVISTLHFS